MPRSTPPRHRRESTSSPTTRRRRWPNSRTRWAACWTGRRGWLPCRRRCCVWPRRSRGAGRVCADRFPAVGRHHVVRPRDRIRAAVHACRGPRGDRALVGRVARSIGRDTMSTGLHANGNPSRVVAIPPACGPDRAAFIPREVPLLSYAVESPVRRAPVAAAADGTRAAAVGADDAGGQRACGPRSGLSPRRVAPPGRTGPGRRLPARVEVVRRRFGPDPRLVAFELPVRRPSRPHAGNRLLGR